MLASLAGVLFIWKGVGTFIEKNLSLLVSFSAGVFLVVVFQLGQETLHHAQSAGQGWIWILAGVLLITFIFRFLPDFHHHHDEQHDHTHSRIDARRIVISDAIHNLGDGILIAATFSISIPLGIATAISIFVHEFVQEVSEFFVLRQAGLSVNRALTVNFLASATILIGAVGGYFVLDSFSALEVPLLGIAAGSFLVVVLHDLIPDSVRHSHETKSYFKYIATFIIGIVLMFGINNWLGHAHEVEHEHDHDHVGEVHDDHDHTGEVHDVDYAEDEHHDDEHDDHDYN
jgi:zinc and cadmium transporter